MTTNHVLKKCETFENRIYPCHILSKIFFLLLTFTSMLICSGQAPAQVAPGEIKFVTEVSFPKGVRAITEEDKLNIKRVYDLVKRNGDIESIKIVSWGDHHYPSHKVRVLGPFQQKLVEDRNDSLEAYLEDLDLKLDIDKFSMADDPYYLKRLFYSQNVRIKDYLEFTKVKKMARVSKSVLMFIPKKGLNESLQN